MNDEIKLKDYIKFMSDKSKDYQKIFPLIFVCNLFFSIISIFTALIGKQLIDTIINMNTYMIVRAVIISIVAFFIGAVIGFVTSYLSKYLMDKLKIKIQLSFYDNMQHSDFIFFSNLSSSDVYYRMFTDISILVDFYLNILVNIPTKILVFISALIIMLTWSWQLTLAILLLIVIQLLIMVLFRKPIKKRAELAINADQTLISKINEDMLKSDVCRNLALESYNKKNIIPYFEDSRRKRLNSTKFTLFYTTAISVSSQIINVCLLLLGIYFVSKQEITIGTLMGISMLVGYIYQPLNDLFNTIISYQTTKVSLTRFKDFDERIDNINLAGTKPFNNGDIVISNLSFSYGASKVLNDFTAILEKGAITYLDGANGAGKTTLMRLITRSLHATAGSIYICGDNINDICYDDFRKNVIAMESESVILNDSFKKNIIIDKNFSEAELNEVIDKCALNNVVSKLEKGIDTIVGLGNDGLSMGELKKVALARVLIRKPQILVLDEPLTHIDSFSCKEILETLRHYNQIYNMTIVIISHDNRIETIAHRKIHMQN